MQQQYNFETVNFVLFFIILSLFLRCRRSLFMWAPLHYWPIMVVFQLKKTFAFDALSLSMLKPHQCHHTYTNTFIANAITPILYFEIFDVAKRDFLHIKYLF